MSRYESLKASERPFFIFVQGLRPHNLAPHLSRIYIPVPFAPARRQPLFLQGPAWFLVQERFQTFMSIDLVKIAVGQFDLGPAAAMSIIYFLIVLLLSWVFYTVMTTVDAEG